MSTDSTPEAEADSTPGALTDPTPEAAAPADSAPGPAAPDPAAVERFVERLTELLVSTGVSRMPARAFAALMASAEGSLTAAELAERLRASPAAVSGAVRYLIGVKMIERRRPIGTRRDEYWLHDDRWFELLMQRDAFLLAWSDQMKEGVAALGADSPAGRRLVANAAFFDFLYTEMQSLMQRWEVRRAELGLDGTA